MRKRQIVSRLSQAGWLARYAVAHILALDSYVSFEAALQFHGLHDQLMQTTASVALKQRQSVVVQEITYQFVKTTPKFFVLT